MSQNNRLRPHLKSLNTLDPLATCRITPVARNTGKKRKKKRGILLHELRGMQPLMIRVGLCQLKQICLSKKRGPECVIKINLLRYFDPFIL